MFQAIRRVISDSEDVGQSHKKAKTEMSSDERAAPLQGGVVRPQPPNTDAALSHLVEPDVTTGVNAAAPLQVVHSTTGHHDTCASNSSLSDGSDNDSDGAEDPLVPASIIQPQQSLPPSPPRDDEKEQIVPPQVLTRVAPRSNTLNRMDSAADGSSYGSQRNSSQNSRDWGWFEDVHQATDGGSNVAEKRDSKKNTDRPPDMAQTETTHGTCVL